MKRLLCMILVTALLLLNVPVGMAANVTGGVYGAYTYSVTDGKATITDYSGAASVLSIPSSIGGYTVTAIGDDAFAYCTSLTQVTIPSTVTYIGNSAFYECRNIHTLTLSSALETIDDWAFYFCSSLYSVLLPTKLTYLGDYAFKNCGTLHSVTIRSDLTYLGDQAFYSCLNLTDIAIPGTVKQIGSQVFNNCRNLAEVTLGDGVEGIGYYAFANTALKKMIIPASVTYISQDAFPGKIALVGTVGSYAERFASAYGYPFSTVCPNTANGEHTFGNSNVCSACGIIPESDFKYTIANGTATVTDFYGTATKVTVPATLGGCPVTAIGEYALSNLKATSITLPDSVTTLTKGAMAYCTKLTSVNISAAVTSIGSMAFVDNDSLTAITVAADNPNYKSVDGVLFTKDGGTLLHYPEGKSSTAYTVPDGVTHIAEYAFSAMPALTSVVLPQGIQVIGRYAFEDCTGLAQIDLPEGLATIDAYAFHGAGLTAVTLPDSLTALGEYAFRECEKMTELTVGSGLRAIEPYTFGNCYDLESVTFSEGLRTIGECAFDSCDINTLVLPNSVTAIGDYAFSYNFSLKDVTLGSGLTSIGSYAFCYCESLDKLFVPATVTTFGEELFLVCPVIIYGDKGSPIQRYAEENYIPFLTFLNADADGDGETTTDDAVYLLYYTMLPDSYPIDGDGDYDRDGTVDADDAVCLLYHILLPDLYPLN